MEGILKGPLAEKKGKPGTPQLEVRGKKGKVTLTLHVAYERFPLEIGLWTKGVLEKAGIDAVEMLKKQKIAEAAPQIRKIVNDTKNGEVSCELEATDDPIYPGHGLVVAHIKQEHSFKSWDKVRLEVTKLCKNRGVEVGGEIR